MVAAPFSDPSFEVWTVNGSWTAPRSDCHFEMHRYGGPQGFARVYGPGYVEWLQKRQKPTFMLEIASWVPASVRYPIEMMTQHFGEMWGSSPCYMLAAAIVKGVDEIAISGVELIGNSEYMREREWVQYFRGIAVGRGIKVTFPGGSGIEGRSTRYGYEMPAPIPPAVNNAVERELELARQKRVHADIEMQRAEGARVALDELRTTCSLDEPTSAAVDEAYLAAEERRGLALTARLEADGAIASASRMERALDLVAVGGAA